MNAQNQLINDNNSQKLDHKKLTSLISAYLSKAEALSGVAAATDFELFTPEIINNYLWSLNDTIRDARKFYNLLVKETI